MTRTSRREPVVSITDAPVTAAAELSSRQRRYLISMTIRTVCFLAAIVVGNGWFRWLLVAAAVVLPYVAVVMANSASPHQPAPGPESPELRRRPLPPGSSES